MPPYCDCFSHPMQIQMQGNHELIPVVGQVMPAVNNLFAVVMHPDSSAGGSFSTLALNSDACRSLFVAMLAPPGYS
jgi:hypothetical protein